MSVLVTMRVKVYGFEGTKLAAQKYVEKMKKAGCHWLRIYRSDSNPNTVLWLMEWESREAFESLGNAVEDDINSMVSPVGAWEEVVWQFSDAVAIEEEWHVPTPSAP
jgi:hypothetical protein